MSAQQALLVHVPVTGSENYWFNILQNTAATFGLELDDHNFDSSGNFVVSGTSNLQHHFWHKIDKNGNIIATGSWNDSSGSSADVSDIAIDESDNIYMANGNGRIIKWDSSNNIVYSKRNTHRGGGGFPNSDLPFGDTGIGYGSLTLSGNTLTYKQYGGGYRRSMQFSTTTGEITVGTEAFDNTIIFGIGGFGKTSQGNFPCGYVNSAATNNANWWVVTKSDNTLEQQYAFYNPSGAAMCRGIDYINDSFHIVGLKQTDNSFAGDGVIFKLGTYSGTGNQGVTWARRIRNAQNTSNGSYQTQLYDVAGDSEGNIYVVGHSPNPGTTTCGIMLKYNSSGTVIWSRFFENSSGTTMCTKITIVNDVMWVNINISGDKCAVAKLPTNGEFMGNYCGLTITDWSQGYQGGFTSSSINHIQQSGSTPNILGGYSNLPLGSPVTASYTEPSVSPTECISVAGILSSVTESTTSVSEGAQMYVYINTVDSPNGTQLYWQIVPVSGTINASDFQTFSGSVTVSNNTAQIAITTANDSATEGTEQFVVKIYSEAEFTNVLGTTNTITINDTSTAPISHSFSSGTHTVPANAFDISIECAGCSGGKGGAGGASRSNGGSGRTSWFTINLTPPFTVALYAGTKGVDAYDTPVGDGIYPNNCSGWSGGAGGTSAVGMGGGTGGQSGGIDNAGSKSCNVGGGGSGGAGSLIIINGTYAAIAGGGGGGGGSAGSTVGDAGGNYSGYGGSTPWVATTSSLENGSGASGGSGTDTNDAAAGGGSGGGASYTAVAAGAAGGSNASSVGQGGGSGVSAYRSDILNQGSNSHNPNSNGWTWVYYKTP